MMVVRVSSLVKPRGTWWAALGRDERLWVGLVVIWGLSMCAVIAVIWLAIGSRETDIQAVRIEPTVVDMRVEEFTASYKVGELGGVPIVAPPPGGDAYLEAAAYSWRPFLQLKRGQQYRLLLSSRDLQHGFSLVFGPRSLNYQVLPGYITAVSIVPERVGEFPVVCNEYCGLGHHLMLGRVIVIE